MRGKFITLEGSEGVGKSSNLKFIEEYLSSQNIEIVTTREPGGTPLAESIREIVLSPRDEKMCDLTELLLIFAARAQHLAEVVVPALERGAWVLSDRFTDATYAYQGYARGLSLEIISQLESLVQQELRPDLTVILDVDVSLGLQRAMNRGRLDRIESEKIDFFEKVRNGYLTLANLDPSRYVVIDASPSLQDVQASIELQLNKFVHERN
ncbi:MAG: dTMP kinase [Cellvibrionaceae bacterium]